MTFVAIVNYYAYYYTYLIQHRNAGVTFKRLPVIQLKVNDHTLLTPTLPPLWSLVKDSLFYKPVHSYVTNFVVI